MTGLAICLSAAPGFAVQFEKGEAFGSIDTTLSYGISTRTSGRDGDTIAVANGGKGYSANVDDGNLNYDQWKPASNRVSATSELEVNYRDVGAFVRANAFYDFENELANRARTELSNDAEHLVGKRIRLLDAYGWYQFDAGDKPGEIRVGNQVLSWGESTFIQNGINSINPIDVNSLRAPGSELKDALLPVPMVWGSLGVTDNTSVEAFYQFGWRETEVDPAGSFFSGNDFAADGGDRLLLGRGTYADGALPNGTFAPVADTFQAVQRASDDDASDQGQFGFAFRFFADKLNSTEFGFFFVNNHSRLPLVNGVTGTRDGAIAAGRIAGPPDNPAAGSGVLVAGTVFGALGAGATPEQAVQAGVNAGVAAGQTANQAGVIANQAVTEGPQTGASPIGPKTAGAITDSATDAFARTSAYRVVYPDDTRTFGASFNTQIGTSGWALQGEASYRLDVPIQVNDIEVLGATLGAVNAGAAQANQVGNFLGQFETEVPGFIKQDVFQFQTTATKVFGRTLGADALALIGEAGVTWLPSYINQNAGGPTGNGLRLNGPNTGLGGNTALAPTANQAFAGQTLDSTHFVSQVAWGYQIRARLNYNNAIGPVSLSPRLAWRHDVSGISPGPGENFLQGRKAISAGLRADYLDEWSADLSYVNFFGAGDFNLQNDRDFFAFALSYSF